MQAGDHGVHPPLASRALSWLSAHSGSSTRFFLLVAQPEQDDRQAQDGEARARIEPPPQAADDRLGASHLATERRRRGRDNRGNNAESPGVASCIEVFSRPAANPRSFSPALPLTDIVRETLESMNPASPITMPQSTKTRPPSDDMRPMMSTPAVSRPAEPPTGEVTERELDPYGVVHLEGYWYAVGYDHLREGMRIFRLDRVLEAKLLEATFVRPQGFDTPDGVLEALADMPQDRWSVEVLLETTPERAREQAPSMGVSLEETGDGVLMRCSISDLGWMARVLASLNIPFVVRRPPELREALGQRAAEIAALAGRTEDRG